MTKLMSTKPTHTTDKKSILLYIATFCIPFLLLFTLAVFYQLGYGTPFPNILSLPHNLLNGLAAFSFLYFIRHSVTIPLKDVKIQFICSICYGMCTYGILQEQSISILLIYAIFPLLYLSYERMFFSSGNVIFCLISTFVLILNPSCAIPVMLLLFILSFFKLGIEHQCSFSRCIRLFYHFLLPFAFAAFRLLPYILDLYKNNQYTGCSFSYSLSVLFSKFLPFVTPSAVFQNGFDLYFGIMLLIFSISFFFHKNIIPRKRLLYGLYTVLLIAVIECSPLDFVFHLFCNANLTTASYSFVAVFWFLLLAAESFSIPGSNRTALLSGILMTALIIAFSFLGGSHNFLLITLISILVLFLLITLTIVIPDRFVSISKYKTTFLFAYVLIELLINAFISSNQDFINPDSSNSSLYIWNKQQSESASSEESDEMASQALNEYESFSKEHTDPTLISCLNQLINSVSLTEKEYSRYCDTDFPDQIQLINGLCKKIGADDLLLTPIDLEITFDENDEYKILPLSDQIYNCIVYNTDPKVNPTIYPSFYFDEADVTGDNLYLFENCKNSFFSISDLVADKTKKGYLCLSLMEDCNINFKTTIVALNADIYGQIPDLLVSYLAAQNNSSDIYLPYILGLVISIVTIFLELLLHSNTDTLYFQKWIHSVFTAITNWTFPHKLYCHLKKYKTYYLSFLLPFILYFLTMVVFDCVPFGSKSFFDEDGSCLTLPTYLDYYYSFSDGNTYLTMNNAYGSGNYAGNPILQLLYFYKLLKPSMIAPLLLFTEGICIGLCSLFMTIYMTHRKKYTAAFYGDMRVLIPAIVYSLNAYMLTMHGFCGWYFVFLALPLLMLSFDRLMCEKKYLSYILLLSYCIIFNLYLALYICIFLVIMFFTYHFDHVKDFICKGLRFAFCSLLAAGNGFFVISSTLISSNDSYYRETDSFFPSFGFHTNFWDQWTKHMFYKYTPAISSNEGSVSLYCGILTLLLVLIYFISKRSLGEKIRRLLPLFILYLSFNEQILTFIWNGFHYQSKVPNRYVFLLMFLLAELAYDGLIQLKNISPRKFILSTFALICFFVECNYCSSEQTGMLAFVLTIALCILYCLVYIITKTLQHNKHRYVPIFLLLFVLEITVNLFYSTSNYGLTTLQFFGNYEEIADRIEAHLTDDNNNFVRINYPANLLTNVGSIYHSGSNSIFNSFVTRHQTNTGALFGFLIGTNVVNSTYNATPLTLTLSGTKYIFVPMVATCAIHDLDQYKYIGELGQYYVYQNTAPLSLGFYVPDEAISLDSISYLPDFYNEFSSLYTENNDSIFVSQYLQYDETGQKDNSFYFTDQNGQMLSYDEVDDIYTKEALEDPLRPINSVILHLNCKPDTDGTIYFYPGDFIALGSCKKDTTNYYEIPLPNSSVGLRKDYNYAVYNATAFNNFYKVISENQVENITIQNDTIQGKTNYENDGYTMFSIAYDPSWHAYIDGTEIEITDAYNSCIFVKTPAGSHTITLKYIPQGMKIGKLISLVFWIITLFFLINYYLKKRKTTKD